MEIKPVLTDFHLVITKDNGLRCPDHNQRINFASLVNLTHCWIIPTTGIRRQLISVTTDIKLEKQQCVSSIN